MIKNILLNGRKIEYELYRKNVKNINLRVKKDGSISVSAGCFVSETAIERFIFSNADKILCYLDKYKEERDKNDARNRDKSILYLLGKERKIEIINSNKNSVYLKDDKVIVEKKNDADTEKMINNFKEKLIKEIINDMCIDVYPDFSMYMKGFPTIKYRKMTTRNGSCSPQKNILTFNSELVKVPLECIRYVVMHEFCHFIHPNHSIEFHKELDRRMKDNKKWKELLDKEVF